MIGDQLNRSAFVRSSALSSGGIGLARYQWISTYINRVHGREVKYEIYRPWRHYDVLVFLKSMGKEAESLAERHRGRGKTVIFDTNVNHYDVSGVSYYRNMLPTEVQQSEARTMTESADAVIADSEYLLEEVKKYNDRACWISDCVDMDAVPQYQPSNVMNKRVRLLWCGQSLKLFELLAIEEVITSFKENLELVIVTNDMASMDRWFDPVKERFRKLLEGVSHTIVPYESIGKMFDVYTHGGVVISPRLLDNTYNMGHTEWKITLGMACGRFTVCSPVPSYQTVCTRAVSQGIRVCSTTQDWADTFERLLTRDIDLGEEEKSAREVVKSYYSSAVVGEQHLDFVRVTSANCA